MLGERLRELAETGGEYKTVKSRELQLEDTVRAIDARVVLIGNGYSTSDLPDQLDIHNGFLAALFHFGVAGLGSQLCLIWFFGSKARRSDIPLKNVLLGSLVVFGGSYLTGPPLARRSLWIPMLVMGSFTSVSLKRGNEYRSRAYPLSGLPRRRYIDVNPKRWSERPALGAGVRSSNYPPRGLAAPNLFAKGRGQTA